MVILGEGEAGVPAAEVGRKHGISNGLILDRYVLPAQRKLHWFVA